MGNILITGGTVHMRSQMIAALAEKSGIDNIYVVKALEDLDDQVVSEIGGQNFIEYACPDAPRRTYKFSELTPEAQKTFGGIEKVLATGRKKRKDSRKYQRH